MSLSEDQIQRYSRHILLKEVGGIGQEKILHSKILLVGAGGLGSPAGVYLAAAGVGTIGIVDGDNVDITNLQRQIFHETPDIGRPKVDSAREKIEKINPDVKVITYRGMANADNITEMINDYDFIIDCTDNFPTKFLINDACVFSQKAFSHGGILQFHGQSITYTPGHACLRCLFNSPPPPGSVPSCSEAGVLGVVAGSLGALQAAEALKYILKIGKLLTNTLYHFDVLTMDFGTIKINPNKKCPICGKKPKIKKLVMSEDKSCSV